MEKMRETDFLESMEDLRMLVELFDPENTKPLEGLARQRVATVVRRTGQRLMAEIPDRGAVRAELLSYQERWLSWLKEAGRPTALPEHRQYRF